MKTLKKFFRATGSMAGAEDKSWRFLFILLVFESNPSLLLGFSLTDNYSILTFEMKHIQNLILNVTFVENIAASLKSIYLDTCLSLFRKNSLLIYFFNIVLDKTRKKSKFWLLKILMNTSSEVIWRATRWVCGTWQRKNFE